MYVCRLEVEALTEESERVKAESLLFRLHYRDGERVRVAHARGAVGADDGVVVARKLGCAPATARARPLRLVVVVTPTAPRSRTTCCLSSR